MGLPMLLQAVTREIYEPSSFGAKRLGSYQGATGAPTLVVIKHRPDLLPVWGKKKADRACGPNQPSITEPMLCSDGGIPPRVAAASRLMTQVEQYHCDTALLLSATFPLLQKWKRSIGYTTAGKGVMFCNVSAGKITSR